VIIMFSILEEIQQEFESKVHDVQDIAALEELRVSFLGKKGALSLQMKQLGSLNTEERKEFGMHANKVRHHIEAAIADLKADLHAKAMAKKLASEHIDISLTARTVPTGKVHPITQTIEDIKLIMGEMGFGLVDGPEVEDDWHNFTALNIPEEHPARQMHDTFYTDDGGVLRTHTSNVQIRYMTGKEPPFKILSIGRVYRSDYDATHTPMFHQAEGLFIAKDVNMGHLKGCLEQLLMKFFNLKAAPKLRFRSSYFPFTEPSAEVDILCDRSSKTEIKIGSGNDWLEILGCGMVHPQVLKNVGVDPDKYQGFAFGIGVERMAMLKYNIPDLRKFFEGDVRWLKHYGF
jgi:phenylalanyl-tRNA synthetase alpha chain